METTQQNQNGKLMTRREAAAYLSVCLTTLDRLNLPKIKFRRQVRYSLADLNQFLEQSKTEVGGER